MISGIASVLSRLRRVSWLGGRSKWVLVALTALAVPAFAIETQIYDAKKGKWVNYDQRTAVKLYRKTGQAPEDFRRQVVTFRTAEEPGTIIIDGDKHYLYYVLPNFQAIRYGIGVGRDGFGWAGIVEVGRKAEWPRWTPPAEMVARDPNAAKWKDGMPGGPDNPLGARAMYLYVGGQDSIYRIHGTTQPWSIGLNISSGCIRMINEDVIDLYDRVKVGTRVIVLMQGAALYKGV